jgi:sodium transport system permease protein
MNWRNVKLIFLREVRDQLRDRRTLFMVAILPLILYPVMGIGMVQMTVTFSEQVRTVMIVNAGDLPSPSLIKSGRIDPKYFESPGDAAKLRVITDVAPSGQSLSDAESAFLDEVQTRLPQIREIARVTDELRAAEDARHGDEMDALSRKRDELQREFGDWFEKAPVQVLIVIPPGLKDQIATINEKLASGDRNAIAAIMPEHPILLENSADEKSAIAFRRVREAVQAWEGDLLQARLTQAKLPRSLPRPVDAVTVDLARTEKLQANASSKLFPALLIIMAMTGAFYPAIDLGAGEKERGTMETLLISPASRHEIVTGKFLTVMVFSIATAILNIISMGYTGRHMMSMRPGNTPQMAEFLLPSFPAIACIVLLAIPLAALFSALSLAFAMFARSTKEGQYYLTPLLLVTIGLMMFSLNPSVELTPFYSVMPVVGPALLLKALLMGSTAGGTLPFFAVAVTVSSLCYAILALWWAIEQFQQESILFREAERFDIRLWLRHLLREKEAVPSFSEAAFCFLLILLLQFATLNVLGERFRAATDATSILRLQMISLLATVGAPAILMAALLTADPLRTLKLRLFHPKWLAAGIILPFVLNPLAVELLSRLKWFFPDIPQGAETVLGTMAQRNLPLWLPLMAFAVVPAVCEELAFRGFILSGLQRTQRYRLAAVMSSVAFGIIHMIPQQVFNATLLGLVLAALALRSGSLIPGVIFHFIFNGIQVLFARMTPEQLADPRLNSWITFNPSDGVRYTWPVLVGCAIVAAPMLYWLVRGPVVKGWRDANFRVEGLAGGPNSPVAG